MAKKIDLIYCADGNKRLAQIAIDAGFLFGAQLPNTIYHDPYFVDQNWKNPNREKYIQALAQYRPYIASVIDWEREDQLPEVLEWAEDAARYVQVVMIIPKVPGKVHLIPRFIGGKPVRLGYSVPTRFGGTPVHTSEFLGWPVHLLGGSPEKQMKLAGLRFNGGFWHNLPRLNVLSVDGNYHQKMATRFNQFWVPGTARYAKNSYWPTLKESGGGISWGDGSQKADAPYEAFRRSCENIMQAWKSQVQVAMAA